MRIPTTIIIAGAIALIACGVRAASQPDACALVPAAAAGKILGAKVAPHPMDTSAAGPGAASMCRYSTGHIGGGFMLLAGRVHYTSAAKEVAERKQEAVADVPPGVPKPVFADVKGLGDAAYLVESSGYFQLHVLDHDTVVVINMNRNADAGAVAQAEKLARVALAHLKQEMQP